MGGGKDVEGEGELATRTGDPAARLPGGRAALVSAGTLRRIWGRHALVSGRGPMGAPSPFPFPLFSPSPLSFSIYQPGLSPAQPAQGSHSHPSPPPPPLLPLTLSLAHPKPSVLKAFGGGARGFLAMQVGGAGVYTYPNTISMWVRWPQ